MQKKALTKKDLDALARYKALLVRTAAQHLINPFEDRAAQAARIARAKVDFNYFARTYFPDLCSHECAPFHIEAANHIKANKHCRELKAMGRGLAKSITYDTLIPLWLWINDEVKTVLCISANADKAAELMEPLKAQFEANDLFRHDFGAQETSTAWAANHFVTQNGTAFFALGLGQSPRGIRNGAHRVDYLIFDDCDSKEISRNPQRLQRLVNWTLEDALGTTSPRASRVIFLNNIFAQHTILTTIRDKRNDKGRWRFTQVNATDTNGDPTWDYPGVRAYYQLQRETMGVLSFESEYNNSPYTEGSIFTDEMIRWGSCPPLKDFERIVAHWDVAYSDSSRADYNAVRVWGLYKKQFYLIDCFVKQCKMSEAIRWMYHYKIEKEGEVRIAFYYESQFWNEALQMTSDQVAREFPEATLRLIKNKAPKQAKLDRIMELHPLYQEGRIIYNIEREANPYFHIGLEQLKGIEPGYKSHDDAPDSDAAAIQLLAVHAKSGSKPYKTTPSASRKY